MSYGALDQTQEISQDHAHAVDVKTSILNLTKADILPRPALTRALTDNYFKHVHPFIPVVEESDLYGPKPSILLQQAVCLAGSLMQHDPASVSFCLSQYEKVKTLIHLNHESDKVTLLKSLCLLTCHSPLPTDRVTLDGPWQWLGMAIRLAVQLGLHKTSTYEHQDSPGCLRRVFWHLIHSDRLSASCWGRPLALRRRDHDIPPLSELDFTTPGLQSQFFLQMIGLSETIGTIADISNSQSGPTEQDATALVDGLCDWIRCLPKELHLYNSDNARLPFYCQASELHIIYFAAIILLQSLDREHRRSSVAASSLTAATCIAKLYEEIHCREETVHLLHIHGFFCMVAAVPLICFPHGSRQSEAEREEEVDIICSVLNKMRCRYGGSDLVLRKIRRLQQDMERDTGHGLPRDSSTMLMTRRIRERQRELFPYPSSFCSFTDSSTEIDPRNHTAEQAVMETERGPDFLSDNFLNLADILAMDYDCLDMGTGEGFGSQ
ncbi:fungal-specific transcription factor domain-containing protein [Thelonectria olida]|uniref:Fungal-specific transcription factor domain-containing protein n=1 Tax=Thelonectria olida TaxID=1576542 RepID=A0A9P9AJ34_9HYPO|nr:fungal-specific transcription factor domain-containing protein [Thelonectria olida]